MARVVQHRRGTTADHTGFTGAPGEITVDTDKKTPVVHDGVTAGGFPVARESLSNTLAVLSSQVRNIVVLWQTEYDALVNKDRYTLYVVTPITLDANDVGLIELVSIEADFVLL